MAIPTCSNCVHLKKIPRYMPTGLGAEYRCAKNAEPDPMPDDWDGEDCEKHEWNDEHWMCR